METKFKITIPKPCHEDWDGMKVTSIGRFCNVCTTEVVDFTDISSDEIRSYLAKNNTVCGRFKNDQLDSVTIQIPTQVLFSQVHFHKIFMLALLITMDASLFSCQNANGTKQKIESIEVVEDEPKMTVGLLLPLKDSINNNIKTHKKENKENVVIQKIAVNEKSLVHNKISKTGDTIKQIYEDNYVYGMPGITIYPEYAGGFQMLDKFIKENYVFPKKVDKKNGKIVVSFAVNKVGVLEDFKVKNDFGFETGNLLIEVLKKTPKWYPAELYGKRQIVYYDINLDIKNDTIDKFLGKKIIPKIDKIELIRITKFDH
ncbi:hypothetical protein [Flavobacterium sp.]|uniref:hypothetical protein n=1 Tax=Flavobacterium sp. TaxID=239 RepID=UPI003752D8F9